MALTLAELLSHLPENDRASYLRLPKRNLDQLRQYILDSERLPRSKDDLMCAPGTVSGPAIGRTREVARGFVELRNALHRKPHIGEIHE